MPQDDRQGDRGTTVTVSGQPRSLGDLLQRIAEVASTREQVRLSAIMQAVGTRSFGPVLLLIGVILVSPLSGIPGMPTTMGVLLFLTSIQLLVGRQSFWMPDWLLRRSVPSGKLQRALRWLERPARFIDSWLRPRLLYLASSGGAVGVAAICSLLALAMPLMEVVPFSATAAGAAIVTFGLALVALDGLFVLIGAAYLMTVASLAIAGLL